MGAKITIKGVQREKQVALRSLPKKLREIIIESTSVKKKISSNRILMEDRYGKISNEAICIRR